MELNSTSYMNNINGVILISTTSSMSSGASWSLLSIARNLKENHIKTIVVVPEMGDLVQSLYMLNIQVRIINYFPYDTWVYRLNYRYSPFRFINITIKKLLNYVAHVRLIILVATFNPSIIHINSLTSDFGYFESRLFGTLLFWHAREFLKDDLNLEFVKIPLARKKLTFANKILCVSNSVNNYLKSNYALPNLTTVYNGIDESAFISIKAIDYSIQPFVFSIVGRICPNKSQLEVLKVISLLDASFVEGIHLNIVGSIDDSIYYKKIKSFIRDNNLSSIVSVLPQTNNISEIYSSSHFIIVPSVREAFGRVVAECMLSRRIPLVNNYGGSSELIDDGETGFLFDLQEPESLSKLFLKLLSSKYNLNLIADNARDYALANYTSKINFDNILAAYTSGLNS